MVWSPVVDQGADGDCHVAVTPDAAVIHIVKSAAVGCGLIRLRGWCGRPRASRRSWRSRRRWRPRCSTKSESITVTLPRSLKNAPPRPAAVLPWKTTRSNVTSAGCARSTHDHRASIRGRDPVGEQKVRHLMAAGPAAGSMSRCWPRPWASRANRPVAGPCMLRLPRTCKAEPSLMVAGSGRSKRTVTGTPLASASSTAARSVHTRPAVRHTPSPGAASPWSPVEVHREHHFTGAGPCPPKWPWRSRQTRLRPRPAREETARCGPAAVPDSSPFSSHNSFR